MDSLPLVGSQCCPTRACNKSFQSFDDKTTLSKSFDSSFSQSNVGTFSHVSTSCGLSKRRISAVFSCFDQSLILLAASITRSQTILPLFREKKNLDKNIQGFHKSGKDSPQFADCDVQQLWCCLLLGEDEASDKRESLIIINCVVGDKFGIDQIFVGGSYLLGYIWRHEVSFLGHHVLLLIDIA